MGGRDPIGLRNAAIKTGINTIVATGLYWEGEGQRNPYCLAVIPPKLLKLRKSFADKVKPGA